MKPIAHILVLSGLGLTTVSASPFSRSTTILSHLLTCGPVAIQHPNNCYLFTGSTSLPIDGAPSVADCKHLTLDIIEGGPRLWPLNRITQETEIAVYSTCAFSVYNPSDDNIIVSDYDVRTILEFWTGSMAKEGGTQGIGSLSCETPVAQARELRWKVDFPGRRAVLADLKTGEGGAVSAWKDL